MVAVYQLVELVLVCYFVAELGHGLDDKPPNNDDLAFRPVQTSISKDCINLNSVVSEKDVSDFVFNQAAKRANVWDRPVRDANKPVYIGITFAIKAIIDIEERSQLVKLNGYFPFAWHDDLHLWNDTFPLSCIDYLIVPHEDLLWLPDVAVMNSDSKYAVTQAPNELVRIYSDGRIHFSPGGIVQFYCAFDLSLFPFDEQICALELESWRYTVKKQIFTSPAIMLINATEHQQWAITGLNYSLKEVSYPNGNSFSTLTFIIKLKRKNGYYSLTVILPSLLVAAAEVVTFATPYNKGNRLEVSFTCLLAFSVFQTMIIADMPKSADHPPLLLIMVCLLTVYIGVAIYLQSFCILLGQKAAAGSTSPPTFFFNLAKVVGRFIGLSFVDNVETKHVRDYSTTSNNNKDAEVLPGDVRTTRRLNKKKWNYVGLVSDRCAVIFFVSLLVITSIVMLAIIPVVGKR